MAILFQKCEKYGRTSHTQKWAARTHTRTLFRKDFARTRTHATAHRTCACAYAPSQLIPWFLRGHLWLQQILLAGWAKFKQEPKFAAVKCDLLKTNTFSLRLSSYNFRIQNDLSSSECYFCIFRSERPKYDIQLNLMYFLMTFIICASSFCATELRKLKWYLGYF